MALLGFKARKFLMHRVLHADDSPHVLALGVAIAVFVAFLPIVGIQTVVAIALAALFRANKVVCIPIVWITNPATLVPVYYGCYRIGRLVMPVGSASGEQDIHRLKSLADSGSIFKLQFWADLFRMLLELGTELWVGCILVGVALGLLSYGLSRWGVSAYRERRRQRLLRRSLFRSKLQRGKVTRRSEPV